MCDNYLHLLRTFGPGVDKMSSQMLYRYILILSEGIPEDEAANYVG